MIQFATYPASARPVDSQVREAIAGGCLWVRLTGSSEEEIKTLIPLCTAKGVILVLDDNVELVDKLRIHGIHLTAWDRGSVIAVREKLGPHAIVGVACDSAEKAMELKGLDVDYMTVAAPSGVNPLDFFTEFAAKLKAEDVQVHPVASGEFPVAMLRPVLDTGMAGVELSEVVADASNPAEFMKLALSSVNNI